MAEKKRICFVLPAFFPETKGIALEDMEEAMSGKGVQPNGKPALAFSSSDAVANP